MSAQTLDRVLTAYRIGDPSGLYPIFDDNGSRLWPGRWNTAASPMIYASAHYSTATLEKLVHGNGRMPPSQHWIEITIPPGISYEVFSAAHHPSWADKESHAAKAFGDTWQRSGRSLVLIVPSVVARMESNYLINAGHPEFGKVSHGLPQPIWWDERLFRAPPPRGNTRRPRRT